MSAFFMILYIEYENQNRRLQMTVEVIQLRRNRVSVLNFKLVTAVLH